MSGGDQHVSGRALHGARDYPRVSSRSYGSVLDCLTWVVFWSYSSRENRCNLYYEDAHNFEVAMISSVERMEGLFIDEDISRYALTIYTKFVKIVFSSFVSHPPAPVPAF